MPWTAKQRALFHAEAERGTPGMAKLAKEADSYAKKGEEKPPVSPRDVMAGYEHHKKRGKHA